MSVYRDSFWNMRLEHCARALAANNFAVHIAEDGPGAGVCFRDKILPGLEVATASWGDSLSLQATGILDILRAHGGIEFIETFSPGISRAESFERRRRALTVDLFLTGTNAVTRDGRLVNLDMVGNRVAGITFGPRFVVLVVGRNKLVPDLDAALERIRNYAAPLNAIRHEGWQTPCMKTSFCMDCDSPDRICNTWTITEKSYPPGRIQIILVNRDLGL